MTIHSIKITNFKSIYGSQSFDFDQLKGLIKLSGPIGSGKTSISEAILYGLYGSVKGQNIGQLVSWNAPYCEIELNLTSKNKNIHIIRNNCKPLIVEIDGKLLAASNKKDTQSILEDELYDVPKLAVTKMCVISFSAFNSLAAMSPAETKQFLDDIFGFKLFTDYNNEIILERKEQENEQIKLESILNENNNQIANLRQKQQLQTVQLKESLNIEEIKEKRAVLIQQGISFKEQKQNAINERNQKNKEYDIRIKEYHTKMTEAATLGKQAKNHYNTFKSGKCPTCGHAIDPSLLDEYKEKMNEYANVYRVNEAEKTKLENEKEQLLASYVTKLATYDEQMNRLREQISAIDASVKSYNDSVQLIQDNYDLIIQELELKNQKIQEQLNKCYHEINEWDEMHELFTKTLRYNLLETLIPHINKSIQYFINKLDQSYVIKYDQEFKPHIFVDGWDKEIAYNNLSTGQRKSLDLAIIFGILQNIISTIDMNVFVLDELFSNMDSNTRNTMLSLLNETMSSNNSIFVINHAEMQDDYFKHKIRVRLENQKYETTVKKEKIITHIKKSVYEQISF